MCLGPNTPGSPVRSLVLTSLETRLLSVTAALLFFVFLSRQHDANSGEKPALRGGEGSYRGLGVEGGGAMLKGVGAVAVGRGGRGGGPNSPHWLDGTRSRLEGRQILLLKRN